MLLQELEDDFGVFGMCHSCHTGILIETHEGLDWTRHSMVSICPTVFSTETRGGARLVRKPMQTMLLRSTLSDWGLHRNT